MLHKEKLKNGTKSPKSTVYLIGTYLDHVQMLKTHAYIHEAVILNN